MYTTQVRVASVLVALGIVCGAFGAHGLKTMLSPYALTVYETAVFYHLTMSIGLLVLPLLGKTNCIISECMRCSYRLLLLGIVIFCGSLYLLAVTGVQWLGAITPIGGLLMIGAWLYIALRGFNCSDH